MNTFVTRMIGASRMNAGTYEQVEADRTANGWAVLVVIMASIAAAVGSGARDIVSVVAVTIVLLITWVVWVALAYYIGTHLLPEPQTHSNIGELVRTTGFSAAPGVLHIFGLLPGIGTPVFIGITVWMLLTFIVAVRQALDYGSSGRAVAVCLLGWVIHWALLFAFVRVAI